MLWSALIACGPQLVSSPQEPELEPTPSAPSALVGVTPEDGELSLFDQGRTAGVNAGLALSADGLWAHAGMKGFTCDILTEGGNVAADLDYPGQGDEVIDGGDDRLLIRTNAGLFVTRFNQHTASGQLVLEFLADARLVDGGVAALAWTEEGCHVGWYTEVDAPDAVTTVDEDWCGAGVTMLAERDTGTVWLLEAGSLLRVRPEGLDPYEVGGEHLAWDPVHQRLWVARDGHSVITEVDPDGGEVHHTTSGPVQALSSLGQVGALVVGSPGLIEVLWGGTGEVWGTYEGMVQPDGDLTASDSGAVLGLTDGTAARFFLGEVF